MEERLCKEFKKALGKRIQTFRKAGKFTQEQLAELIGIEVPSLSNIETGKYAPSIVPYKNYLKYWVLDMGILLF